jgi:hypothetical protein
MRFRQENISRSTVFRMLDIPLYIIRGKSYYRDVYKYTANYKLDIPGPQRNKNNSSLPHNKSQLL